ncbi:UNVERIFIED_CONTAM: hypothetical protein K2H54_049283 [Gekko kuhli]
MRNQHRIGKNRECSKSRDHFQPVHPMDLAGTVHHAEAELHGPEYSVSSSYLERWNQEPQFTDGQTISGRAVNEPGFVYLFRLPLREQEEVPLISHCSIETASDPSPEEAIGDPSPVMPGWWVQYSNLFAGVKFGFRELDTTIMTDASLLGWGAHSGEH